MSFSRKKIIVAICFSALAAAGLSGCESGEETIARLVSEAEAGNVDAMLKIAEIYCGAKNIAQDDQVCGIWMKKAAENGNLKAQYMLGIMYEQGLGMRADMVEAYKWHSIAAKHGYSPSGAAAKKLEKAMLPSQLNQAKKLLEENAAEK